VKGARRTAVVLNAAAALVVTEIAGDFKNAVKRAGDAIDSGEAREVLERLAISGRP
jgi:anthranilate phosphoribosyltransferase